MITSDLRIFGDNFKIKKINSKGGFGKPNVALNGHFKAQIAPRSGWEKIAAPIQSRITWEVVRVYRIIYYIF